MNISRYAWTSFRHYARRGMIFSMILSAMLISGVFNIATSLQHTLFEEAVAAAGNAHAKYMGLTDAQANELISHPSIAWTDTQYTLDAWGKISDDAPDSIGLIHSTYLGNVAGFNLTAGRAPTAENEVALPPHVAALLGIEARIGEAFTIAIQTSSGQQAFRRLTVCGILQPQRYLESMDTHVMFVSRALMESYAEPSSGNTSFKHSIFVHFKDGYPPEQTARELASGLGIETKQFELNLRYLNLHVTDPSALLALAVILGILLLTGALVIYNAFNMMIVRRIQDFGMLKLIGASAQQIRHCVYLEGLLSTAYALPVGLLLGTLISWLALPLLHSIMPELVLLYDVSLWNYLLTILLTILMVFIGVMRPARKAARITPVEAVKFAPAGETHHPRREVHNVSLRALAKLNTRRNKGRMFVTVLTLSISGMLFLAVSSVGFSMLDSMERLVQTSVTGDIQILAGEKTSTGFSYSSYADTLTPALLDQITAIDGVERMEPYWIAPYENEEPALQNDGAQPRQSGSLVGVEDDLLSALLDNLQEGTPSLEDLKNPENVLAINAGDAYSTPYQATLGQLLTIYPGDSMLTADNAQATESKRIPRSLRVVGILDKNALSGVIPSALDGNLPKLCMAQSVLGTGRFGGKYESAVLYIDRSKHDTIVTEIDRICRQNGNIHYESNMEKVREMERQLMGVIVLIMLMVFVLALVGTLNLVSTIHIGIEQRKREFGVLRALGLSMKGLSTLLTYEGLRVSILSILFSSTFGVGVGYALYHLMYRAGIDYLQFVFPFFPLLCIIIVFIFVPFIIVRIKARQLLQYTTTQLLGHDA